MKQLAQSTTTTTSGSKVVDDALIPNLSIDIPGVSFSEVLEEENVLTIGFLGDYISGVYLYLIGIGTTIAIVFIMIAGLRYAMAAGGGDLDGAKRMIRNAVTGLVLLLCVYLLLFIINPNLTLFRSLELVLIPEPEEHEDDVVSGSVATSFTTPTESNIQGPGKSTVPTDLTSAIDAAAKTLSKDGYGMYMTSSYRSVEKQKDLIAQNCKNPPGSATCNPKSGRPTTCILKELNAAYCPHTTGRALDIWATKDGAVCVTQSQCSTNPSTDACRANACQAALIKAMKEQGFCNLQSEAWHFEKPYMSSTCL